MANQGTSLPAQKLTSCWTQRTPTSCPPVLDLADHVEEIDVAEIVGPYAWGLIHHAVESFPCPTCRREGTSLMYFAHDLVNHSLGKHISHPEALEKWAHVAAQAAGWIVTESPMAAAAQHADSGGERRAELAARISALEESLASEPASQLVKYVKRSGFHKGEIVDLTQSQFRELLGKFPPKAVINKKGKVPWELALDVITSELGYRTDEELKQAIERSVRMRREIEDLKKELGDIGLPACEAVTPGEVPCLQWDDQFCKEKAIACDGTTFSAVRSPTSWTLHISGADDFPEQGNEIGQVRYASDATRELKALAASESTQGQVSQSDRPVCDDFDREHLERCVEDLAGKTDIDSAQGVCEAAVDCRVAT